MSWHTGPLALFDLETTGVDPHRDRIVSAAIIRIDPNPGQRPTVTTSDWLLDPGIEIPEGAASIHGITTERARAGGMGAGGAVQEIAGLLNQLSHRSYTVVGHNVSYDLTMLWAECVRHDLNLFAAKIRGIRPVVDTMVLDKWTDTYRKGSRRLVDVCAHYGITLSEQDAHGAAADALAAGRLGWSIAAKYPGSRMDAVALHDWLVQCKREQAESFGRYLVKQGKPDDVSREWPVESPPPGWAPDQLPVAPERVAS